ncbi:MAG TPA: GNAT family N-acetyltransferase, partial [Lysobacter sp.]|nr:GNAT family N-acetyltransferase [Lysobacter sp.]
MTHPITSDIQHASVVRRVQPGDMAELVRMCEEHARYERAHYDASGKEQALVRALFVPTPLLHAWVATAGNRLIGYATAVAEFSTWTATQYLHMDCLFVRELARNCGIGEALLDTVIRFARASGCREVQWQTPEWNVDACRFYGRKGAVGAGKMRFTLTVGRGRGLVAAVGPSVVP